MRIERELMRGAGPVAVLRAATGCDDGAGAAPRSPGNPVLHNGSPELDFTRRSGAEAPDGLEIVAPDGRAGKRKLDGLGDLEPDIRAVSLHVADDLIE